MVAQNRPPRSKQHYLETRLQQQIPVYDCLIVAMICLERGRVPFPTLTRVPCVFSSPCRSTNQEASKVWWKDFSRQLPIGLKQSACSTLVLDAPPNGFAMKRRYFFNDHTSSPSSPMMINSLPQKVFLSSFFDFFVLFCLTDIHYDHCSFRY